MSVKRYSNLAGVSHLCESIDPSTGKPKGDFVHSRDYDLLQAALREALDEWDGQVCEWPDHPTKLRIATLRAQFLDDK